MLNIINPKKDLIRTQSSSVIETSKITTTDDSLEKKKSTSIVDSIMRERFLSMTKTKTEVTDIANNDKHYDNHRSLKEGTNECYEDIKNESTMPKGEAKNVNEEVNNLVGFDTKHEGNRHDNTQTLKDMKQDKKEIDNGPIMKSIFFTELEDSPVPEDTEINEEVKTLELNTTTQEIVHENKEITAVSLEIDQKIIDTNNKETLVEKEIVNESEHKDILVSQKVPEDISVKNLPKTKDNDVPVNQIKDNLKQNDFSKTEELDVITIKLNAKVEEIAFESDIPEAESFEPNGNQNEKKIDNLIKDSSDLITKDAKNETIIPIIREDNSNQIRTNNEETKEILIVKTNDDNEDKKGVDIDLNNEASIESTDNSKPSTLPNSDSKVELTSKKAEAIHSSVTVNNKKSEEELVDNKEYSSTIIKKDISNNDNKKDLNKIDNIMPDEEDINVEVIKVVMKNNEIFTSNDHTKSVKKGAEGLEEIPPKVNKVKNIDHVNENKLPNTESCPLDASALNADIKNPIQENVSKTKTKLKLSEKKIEDNSKSVVDSSLIKVIDSSYNTFKEQNSVIEEIHANLVYDTEESNHQEFNKTNELKERATIMLKDEVKKLKDSMNKKENELKNSEGKYSSTLDSNIKVDNKKEDPFKAALVKTASKLLDNEPITTIPQKQVNLTKEVRNDNYKHDNIKKVKDTVINKDQINTSENRTFNDTIYETLPNIYDNVQVENEREVILEDSNPIYEEIQTVHSSMKENIATPDTNKVSALAKVEIPQIIHSEKIPQNKEQLGTQKNVSKSIIRSGVSQNISLNISNVNTAEKDITMDNVLLSKGTLCEKDDVIDKVNPKDKVINEDPENAKVGKIKEKPAGGKSLMDKLRPTSFIERKV